jgi:hypothetical protein
MPQPEAMTRKRLTKRSRIDDISMHIRYTHHTFSFVSYDIPKLDRFWQSKGDFSVEHGARIHQRYLSDGRINRCAQPSGTTRA